MENKRSELGYGHLSLPEISETDFREHIGDDDFCLVYGNPVIINTDAGNKLVCMAWPMAERLLRATGCGDEADEIIRACAEKEEANGQEKR